MTFLLAFLLELLKVQLNWYNDVILFILQWEAKHSCSIRSKVYYQGNYYGKFCVSVSITLELASYIYSEASVNQDLENEVTYTICTLSYAPNDALSYKLMSWKSMIKTLKLVLCSNTQILLYYIAVASYWVTISFGCICIVVASYLHNQIIRKIILNYC